MKLNIYVGRISGRLMISLTPERGRGWTPFIMVTDLLEEAGEVAAVVKGLERF